jgi:uncharacterized membrane protein YoaK (UPF0700 family)
VLGRAPRNSRGEPVNGRDLLACRGQRGVVDRAKGPLLLIAVATAVAIVVSHAGDRRCAQIAPMSIALGVQNATVRRLAVPDMTTTVLTLTLTGLASDSRLAGGETPR